MNEQSTTTWRRLRPSVRMAGLAVVLLVALGGCDRLIGADSRITRAEGEFANGSYGASMKDVKTALQSEPENARGRVLLSRLSLHFGDPDTASKELDRAVAGGADAATTRALRYEVLLAQHRFQDVLDALDKDRETAEVQRLRLAATARMALGHNDEARKDLDRALTLAPADAELRLLDARWLWAAGKLPEAKQALDQLVADHPDDARARLYQGRLLSTMGDAKGALAAFEAAQKTVGQQLTLPEQFAVLVGLIDSHLALGDVPGAESSLKSLQARAPNAFATLYLKARVAYARKDLDGAANALQKALIGEPGNVPAQLLLGAVLIDQGSLEQAGATLEQLVASHPDNMEARKLLARVYLARRNPVQAQQVLAEAPAGAPHDPGAEWLSGSLLMMTGKTAEGIAQLEAGVAGAPGNVPLRLDLARAYLATGQQAKAHEALKSLPPGAGGAARQQLTVLAEIAGQSRDQARRTIKKLVQANPTDVGLLVTSGDFLLQMGSLDEASGLFDKAVVADAANVDARLGLAAIAMRRGDDAAARQNLDKVIQLKPADERPYLGLTVLALRGNDRAKAKQWLEKAISANPNVVQSRLELAGLEYADNDAARGAALLDQALSVSKARVPTLNRVGQVLMRASQFDQALKRFNEAAALGDEQANINAAAAMLALGQRAEARSRLAAVARRHPAALEPTLLLARLDAGDHHYDQALGQVSTFEQAGGDAAAAAELRGGIFMSANQPAKAVQAFDSAMNKRPTTGLAIKLFRARVAAREPRASDTLRDWLRTHPDDVVVRAALAERDMQQGDFKAAIGEYERVLKAGRSPAVLNNLAWLYQRTGDSRAEETGRQAYEAAPGKPEVADTYGWILVGEGKVAEGLELLAQAAKAAPADPEIQYHHAAALAQSGDRAAAASALRALLDATPTFPSRSDAEKLLKSLGSG